jgi:hypothetical protein
MPDELQSDAAWQSPHLQRLEAGLASAAPQASRDEQQAILYASAFAAGQSTAARGTRRWRGAAALLATIALLAWIPWTSLDLTPGENSRPSEYAKTRPTPRNVILAPVEMEIGTEPRSGTDSSERQLVLDAWQIATPAGEALAAELSKFRSLEPDQQRMTVGSMSQMLDL